MRVVTVECRLAPEHPYPAAPHDAITACQGLLDGGQDVTRLALAGESAGANLAVVTLAAIQHTGLPQPTSAVLMFPMTDLADAGQSIASKADVDPLDVVPGVPHVFQAFAAVLDEGEAALTRAGAFLREHLRTPAAGSTRQRE